MLRFFAFQEKLQEKIWRKLQFSDFEVAKTANHFSFCLVFRRENRYNTCLLYTSAETIKTDSRPKTGDTTDMTPYILLLAAAAAAIAVGSVVAVRHKKQENK